MSGDEAIDDLRDALARLAGDRAPALIAEAEEEALSRAREVLSSEMYAALLEHSSRILRGEKAPELSNEAPERSAGVPEPATETATEPVRAAELGRYVYGVVRDEAILPDDLVGVDPDHAPFPVREGELIAVASRVDLGEFGEESLRQNLNDIEWLEQKARAHEAVLDALLAHNTVVPMRLCTIYSGEEQLRAMLRRERHTLNEVLDHLQGRAEWGAKAIAWPGAIEQVALDRLGDVPESEAASGGVQYLNRKRNQGRAREEAAEIAAEIVIAIHQPLAELAVEALENPPQRPEVSGHDGDMLLNGVYLVEDEDVDRFRAVGQELAERYREDGIEVELTGPWPPYNFVKGSIEAAQ